VSEALDEAEGFLDDLSNPHTLYHYDTKMGCYNSMEIPRPTVSERQGIMISFAIAVDKAMAIEKYDSEGPTAAKIAIIELVGRLKSENGAEIPEITEIPLASN